MCSFPRVVWGRKVPNAWLFLCQLEPLNTNGRVYQSQMHLHRYCLCDLPLSHLEWAPKVNINPGDAGSHQSQPDNKHGLSNTSAWLHHAKLLSCSHHKGLLMALSSPRKASQLQTFPIYQEIKQPGSGWAVGTPGTGSSPGNTELPPPTVLPKPQPAGSAVVSAELPPLAELSCSPAQALQPSSASLCWSQADVLTCEQLLLKNRYPPFQRAKSLGQPGKAGRGHRLDLFLLCAPCGVSHEGASGWRWSLGTRAGAFACWKPFPLESLTSAVCFGICDPHRAIFLHFPILSLLPYSVCRWDQPLSCLSSKEGIMLCHHLSYCSFLQQISIMIGKGKKKKSGSHHLCS